MHKFCLPLVKDYPTTARSQDDTQLIWHLKTYATMDFEKWADPMFRKWRRCCIVEGLRRGVLKRDPGLQPIEGSDIDG